MSYHIRSKIGAAKVAEYGKLADSLIEESVRIADDVTKEKEK